MQIQLPPLAEGEVYLGGFIDANGDITHTILLPGDTRATWSKALDWAKSIGGDLPTRAELAVAYAKHREQFEQVAYWSNEEDADDPGWAWCQFFYDGSQSNDRQSSELRARAVRRLSI
ncbi:hypothetical protein WL21_32610 [Burkholderia ubonensis]|uniref:DUF1566 domain-containing protein n=1 Tax=Burkholderia ubonensis TaxID=101571 RepID=UPI0007577799|nr:DUF1566 domain-containing protein [Burkholderia ubonensis]KVO95530.1 hypothetical protein WJ81_02650 [Burkholderia ubonensis]KVZ58454.1 hypothetical protein WL20_22305 [Burkholderia ubonensis]KVZ75152.1 hypothetical protein WL21_32610 [Burkholderia ubonensis]